MALNWYLPLLIFLHITLSNQIPQIFREKSTCIITVDKGKKVLSYNIPAKLNAENHDYKFFASLCNKNAFLLNSESTALVSLFDKISNSFINTSSIPKPYDVLIDGEDIIINLQNELKCNENENYLITIRFGHSTSKVSSIFWFHWLIVFCTIL